MTGSIAPRTAYQGLVQIFDYNRPFYLCTAAGAVFAALLSLAVPPLVRISIALAVGPALFWICSSLLISHYVYDRSGLYNLSWLPACLSQSPTRWINLHAGIDETGLTLRAMFPGSESTTVDIFDPRKMTEPSIARARRVAGVSSTAADGPALPFPDNHVDTAFLIFAEHELRRHQDRVQLFQEIKRVLRAGGELVLVEHLRDWANFTAFGPGALHFLSERTWHRSAVSAALTIRLRTTVMPFVHVFILQKKL